ncbi:hypothetical protein METHB2_30054 [Candidatus Methylobacter favarea]|uniref:Uncharacterized protein n=1 Tax=Candidatus Methylobacter favarea TaxID=2707345 RepID=A0A8S0X886_9GAMM|nr:hypothetical protein METHB2_30054 [Candidatus Methylobacter favarea]
MLHNIILKQAPPNLGSELTSGNLQSPSLWNSLQKPSKLKFMPSLFFTSRIVCFYEGNQKDAALFDCVLVT